MRKLLAFAFLMLVLFGCKPQVPGEYIQPGDMEDILFDYHLAQGMAQQADGSDGMSLPMRQLAYREAALRKHGVTEAEFDSSMVYYQRHTERLKGIYDNLAKRLTTEAQSLGASVDDANSLGGLTAMGDTANVWKGEQSLVLSPDAPFNHYSFEIKADSSFHKGDRFILNFKSQFIYQDGMRDGVAYVAVVFDNDSVAANVVRITSDGKQTTMIENDKRLGIKCIKGYFVLAKNMESPSATTLRLMIITQINLIRVHQAEPSTPDTQPTDSVGGGAQQADSARKAQAEQQTGGGTPPQPAGEMPDREGVIQRKHMPTVPFSKP